MRPKRSLAVFWANIPGTFQERSYTILADEKTDALIPDFSV